MAVTAYCDIDDVRDRISKEGVELRVDDIPPSDYGGVIDRASRVIDRYLRRRYAPATLAASEDVSDLATSLATYFLCTRRGNPAPGSVAFDYEEAMVYLKEIRFGGADLADVAERRAAAPTMSNIRVRLRPEPHSVVVPAKSSRLGGVRTRRRQRQDQSQQDRDYNHQW